MTHVSYENAAREAIGFLQSRIAEQARGDAVPLTAKELNQLSFSEETASQAEIAAAAAFDDQHDIAEFEAKITELLRRAFRQDVQQGKSAIWHKALGALRAHDIYVLVMVDQAGIPRSQPTTAAVLLRSSPRGLARLRIPALLSAVGFVYFFILPIQSESGPGGTRVFGNLAEKLIPREGLRGVFFLIWIASVIWLGRLLKTKSGPTA